VVEFRTALEVSLPSLFFELFFSFASFSFFISFFRDPSTPEGSSSPQLGGFLTSARRAVGNALIQHFHPLFFEAAFSCSATSFTRRRLLSGVTTSGIPFFDRWNLSPFSISLPFFATFFFISDGGCAAFFSRLSGQNKPRQFSLRRCQPTPYTGCTKIKAFLSLTGAWAKPRLSRERLHPSLRTPPAFDGIDFKETGDRPTFPGAATLHGRVPAGQGASNFLLPFSSTFFLGKV